MALYIDDQPATATSTELGTLLEEGQGQLAPSGRVIVEVRIDGEQLAGEDLDQRAGEVVSDSEVRLTSADPNNLALEVLDQIRGRLDEARCLQEKSADLLQRDEQGDALQTMSQAIDAWLETQEAVMHATGLLGIDLESFTVDGHVMTSYTDELLEKLEQLKTHIQHNEMIGLADMLAYEWPGLVDRWDRLIAAMIKHIEGRDQG